jgi:hypothetical protein
MFTGPSHQFLSAIEQQAFHEGLKASASAINPYSDAQTPHASRAWAKGNQLAFRLNARLGVQYLNAARL